MRRFSLFVPLAFAACSADTSSPAVRVVDGTLHFATSEAYFDFGLMIANLDSGARRRWEASHGFTSMLSYAEDVMDDHELRLGEALGRPDIFSVVRPFRASGGLKSVGGERRISRLSGSDYKGKRRLDYSVEVLMESDGKTPIQHANIIIEQKAKSWKRRFGCWRQHHCDVNFSRL